MRTFPIALKLEGLQVLVVGEGEMVSAKVQALLDAGAFVRQRAAFESEDLDDCWLVIAGGDREVNRRVAAEAKARRVFAVTLDDPGQATAYSVAVVRRGGVTLGVSTDGEAPALAALVREALARLLPEEMDSWMATARSLRRQWKEKEVPFASRRPLLLRALNDLYSTKVERAHEKSARASGASPAGRKRPQAAGVRPSSPSEERGEH
jgi:siroheme synthase-like protein